MKRDNEGFAFSRERQNVAEYLHVSRKMSFGGGLPGKAREQGAG